MTFYATINSQKLRGTVLIGFFVLVTSFDFFCPEVGRAKKAANNATTAVNEIDVLGVVKKTMEQQPSILIQREQANSTQGAYRSSGGPFDWTVETYFIKKQDKAPIPADDAIIETEESSTTGLRFSKLFRSGVSVSPYVQYTGYNYRLVTDQDLSPVKSNTVGLLVKLPLLRGLGYENTAVGEIAAAHEMKAARLNVSHEISLSVSNAVQVFWAYLAAHERLTVLIETEKRAQTMLEKTKVMVQGGEVPAAELVNVQANLADRESSRLTAEQAVVAARAELGMAMGITPEEIRTLPAPAAPFPEPDSAALLQAKAVDILSYTKIATHHRLDLLATIQQNRSLEAILKAAQNRIKPELNLELSLGYDGLKSGSGLSRSLQTTAYNQDSPDWSAGFRVTYPLGNNSSEGELTQAQAQYRQGILREKELVRTIQTDISTVLSSLFSVVNELERSGEAVRNFTTAVDNEREKYLLGETTFLDLLSIEDRLDSALLNRISARQRAANSLVSLRFKTGKLVKFVDEEGLVTLSDLTTLLLPEDVD